MFIRNVENYIDKDNLYYCLTDEKDFLIKNNIHPISSIEEDGIIKWIFLNCDEINNLAKEYLN